MNGQPLLDSGHAVKFQGEGGDEGKPAAMPVPDANANKHYHGRSGKLKSGRPMNVGGSAATPSISGHVAQRRKRK